MRLLIAMLLVLGPLQPCFAKQYPVRLGNNTVIILQEKYGKGKSFIHVHENETTALHAAQTIIQHQGGSLLTLKHGGGRNIKFTLQHRHYEFDPNRIFTDRGIYKTLNAYGDYSKPAHTAVKRLATQILHLLPKGKVIAVHNNDSFSLHDYLPGNEMEHEARQLHYNQKQHYRNFFIVTQKQDFERLKSHQFNSVWQSKSASDDGSLSIRLSKHHYINVEAGYDQLNTQITMLQQA
ncbi:MAG: protein tyrosine phosphatase [Gammaproteobacteria bacterium]